MSTHVVGLRSKNDPTYIKYLAVVKALNDAGIKELPVEIANYFDTTNPKYVNADFPLAVSIPNNKWIGEGAVGIEIKVSDIPKGVEVIRFYNSY